MTACISQGIHDNDGGDCDDRCTQRDQNHHRPQCNDNTTKILLVEKIMEMFGKLDLRWFNWTHDEIETSHAAAHPVICKRLGGP